MKRYSKEWCKAIYEGWYGITKPKEENIKGEKNEREDYL